MEEAETVLPSSISRLLTDHPDRGRVLSGLAHCFRVFQDLGWRAGIEPYSPGFLYAYLTDGPHEIGERIRRSLHPEEIQRLARLATQDEFVSADEETYFEAYRYLRLKGALAGRGQEVESLLDRMLPFLLPIVDPFYPCRLDHNLGDIFGEKGQTFSERTQTLCERCVTFVDSFFAASSSLSLPGRYVLLITEEGRRYRADMVQTFLHADIAEATDSDCPFRAAAVLYPWYRDTSRTTRLLLEEFESLINSAATHENDLQAFLENHPEFLLLLGNYDDVRSQVSIRVEVLIGPLASAVEYRPDFFLHNPMTDLWDLLDIKRSCYRTGLLVGAGAHAHDAFRPSRTLEKALQQMKEYKKVLAQAEARAFLRERHGIRTCAPSCVLLMGKEENFPCVTGFTAAEVIRETGRDAGIDLVTYDQLFRIARHKAM